MLRNKNKNKLKFKKIKTPWLSKRLRIKKKYKAKINRRRKRMYYRIRKIMRHRKAAHYTKFYKLARPAQKIKKHKRFILSEHNITEVRILLRFLKLNGLLSVRHYTPRGNSTMDVHIRNTRTNTWITVNCGKRVLYVSSAGIIGYVKKGRRRGIARHKMGKHMFKHIRPLFELSLYRKYNFWLNGRKKSFYTFFRLIKRKLKYKYKGREFFMRRIRRHMYKNRSCNVRRQLHRRENQSSIKGSSFFRGKSRSTYTIDINNVPEQYYGNSVVYGPNNYIHNIEGFCSNIPIYIHWMSWRNVHTNNIWLFMLHKTLHRTPRRTFPRTSEMRQEMRKAIKKHKLENKINRVQEQEQVYLPEQTALELKNLKLPIYLQNTVIKVQTIEVAKYTPIELPLKVKKTRKRYNIRRYKQMRILKLVQDDVFKFVRNWDH